MKQWLFEHIIMKLFNKEISQWFHNEVYEPMMKPLPDNLMDNITEEDWKRSEEYTKELMMKLHQIS